MPPFLIRMLSAMWALVLISCSGPSNTFVVERARNIKTVAVVGFEIVQALPVDIEALPPDERAALVQKIAQGTYTDFTTLLAKTTKWSVMPYSDTTTNKTYALKVLAEGKQPVEPPGSVASHNTLLAVPANILPSRTTRKMTPAERTALAKALLVDAIVEVSIVSSVDQVKHATVNTTRSVPFTVYSKLEMAVYAVGSESPVWEMSRIYGERKSSVHLPPDAKSVDKFFQTSLASAQSASTNAAKQYPVRAATEELVPSGL